MTPALKSWAGRVGRRMADQHRTLRKPQDAGAFLNAEIRKSGPLLAGLLRGDVEAAFWRRLAEHEESRS